MKKSLIVVSCMLLCCVLLTGCNKKTPKSDKKIKVVVNKLNGITLNYSFTLNKNILLKVKNKEDINLDIAFFNASHKLLRVESKHIFSNSDSISKVYTSGLTGEKDVVKIVEITPNKIKTSNGKYNHYENNIKTSYTENKSSGKMNVVINNDSGKELDFVSYSIILYKNKNIVDVINYTNEKVGASKNQEVFLPLDETSKNAIKTVDHDEIKIKVDSAIKYEG